MEKGLIPAQKRKEELVALPDGKRRDPGLRHPLQHALIAGDFRAAVTGGGKEMHPFRRIRRAIEIHDPAVVRIQQRIARLLPGFPQHAGQCILSRLELSAHADPFVVVHIIFLLYPVQHEIAVVLLDIAQCGLQ